MNLEYTMQVHLVVVKSFDEFRRGDIITDQTRVASILAGERRHSVVKVVASEVREG